MPYRGRRKPKVGGEPFPEGFKKSPCVRARRGGLRVAPFASGVCPVPGTSPMEVAVSRRGGLEQWRTS